MERMFEGFTLCNLELANRFILPPVKLGYGGTDGTVTEKQLVFYDQIAKKGPGLLILEPVAVTLDGREHPRQHCFYLPKSGSELKKIVDTIHAQNRAACIHLNHAGGGAHSKVTGSKPKAPSIMTCTAKEGAVSEELTEKEIETILLGYELAAKKAKDFGFDMIEIQCGHGYLVSQFLNPKINKRQDRFGQDLVLFAKKAILAVKQGAPGIPLILRISGNEMSPEFGLDQQHMAPLLQLAQELEISAIHVGMGNTCFSPPWYFHHASLPDKPQMDALAWVRQNTSLPVIAAGRMGRKEKIQKVLDEDLADLAALGRPLIADPDLIEKWQTAADDSVMYCGYCLQGCLHRLKNGKPLGCNFNPELGLLPAKPTPNPMKVLIAGGGPAGMSTALYMQRRGHKVTLAEKKDHLGGQFALAWQAPGKENLKSSLESLDFSVRNCGASILLDKSIDKDMVKNMSPDLFVWAVGALQNKPEIPGLANQHVLTSLEYFRGKKKVQGPRVLVIGAGRTGIEIAEKLGREGYDVIATKRTDPIGGMMEMITKKLALMRIGQMQNVALMPHTTVKKFGPDGVYVEKDGEAITLEPFQTVILASGMLSAPGPDKDIAQIVPKIEIIGDAFEVRDIFSAVHAGYDLSLKY